MKLELDINSPNVKAGILATVAGTALVASNPKMLSAADSVAAVVGFVFGHVECPLAVITAGALLL